MSDDCVMQVPSLPIENIRLVYTFRMYLTLYESVFITHLLNKKNYCSEFVGVRNTWIEVTRKQQDLFFSIYEKVRDRMDDEGIWVKY